MTQPSPQRPAMQSTDTGNSSANERRFGDSENVGATGNRVANRAYELFEASGRQHGRHDEHWFQAEREIKGSTQNGGAGAAS